MQGVLLGTSPWKDVDITASYFPLPWLDPYVQAGLAWHMPWICFLSSQCSLAELSKCPIGGDCPQIILCQQSKHRTSFFSADACIYRRKMILYAMLCCDVALVRLLLAPEKFWHLIQRWGWLEWKWNVVIDLACVDKSVWCEHPGY